MIHLFLDDYRHCPKGFELALTAEQCKQMIDTQEIDILSLDYDLGWNQDTGAEVVRHIVSTGRYPKQVFLHTSSAAGRVQMYQMLYANAPKETKVHNGPMPFSLLEEIASL
ncbi:cell division protein FtsJ [Paenibacillus sp. BIHB 4019]|uniref:Cell division protein FtsJ n=1 Tax=Paenibacillus sp. BIHB 4019 TaxID=1870819 RepID=A0A1B2DN59_9BACL|nr:cyclic-phosphate processing receiver domain-containing protein [Paenibacillus sp. BIHB 4019]ANY69148.1 cell division protein FtsJ [Paenibacillus sp. BIHB 4019]